MRWFLENYMSDDVSGAVQQGYKYFCQPPQAAAKIATPQLIRQPLITIVTQKENTGVQEGTNLSMTLPGAT